MIRAIITYLLVFLITYDVIHKGFSEGFMTLSFGESLLLVVYSGFSLLLIGGILYGLIEHLSNKKSP